MAAGVHCGIKKSGKKDLGLIVCPTGATAAAVFTTNKIVSAAVTVCKQHVKSTNVSVIVVNSGNANAGTGEAGIGDAQACCRAVAELTGVDATEVLPFSTGVIGQDLPIAPFERALPALLAALSEDGWARAARAIMTTDTFPKGSVRQVEIDGKTVSIAGIAKGSGMIAPDMATMLVYIFTDARIAQPEVDDDVFKGIGFGDGERSVVEHVDRDAAGDVAAEDHGIEVLRSVGQLTLHLVRTGLMAVAEHRVKPEVFDLPSH